MDARDLINLIRDADGEPYSYSGRAMYGRRCVAVSDIKLHELVYQCAHTRQAGDLLRSMRTDSMGLGKVFYWPNVEWPADFDEA